MQLQDIFIRAIREEDDAAIAAIIRGSLLEFNAARPGTVYFDQTTDQLSLVFTAPGSKYFIAEYNGEIIGGAGIFPTEALPPGTAELVKLYLMQRARGIGLGKLLMETCEAAATTMGYRQVYLETMPELSIAVPMYEKHGYRRINAPMGNSGHCGCDIWMLKELHDVSP
jgi:putative acetyltransferase